MTGFGSCRSRNTILLKHAVILVATKGQLGVSGMAGAWKTAASEKATFGASSGVRDRT